MRQFKTLVLCSLVAGMAAPLLAGDMNDLYESYKRSDQEIPAWLTEAVFGPQDAASNSRAGGDDMGSATYIPFVAGGSYVDAATTTGLTDMYVNPGAPPMNCSYSFFGSTFGGPDAFYTFTLDGSYTVEVSTCDAAAYDSALGILNSAGELVAVSDDGSGCTGYTSWIEGCCLDPGTYFIVVDAYGSGSGDYTMTVNFGAEPCAIVDPCDTWTETPVTLPYHGLGNNVGATDIYGSAAGDIGYSFTLTEPTAIELQTCFDGTLIDTDSHWWMGGGPCDGGTYLGYNDGDSACGWATNVVFGCDAPLEAGDYVVVITGYSSYEGDFELDITAIECAPVEAGDMPVAFDLKQNHPNPFNPTTTIDFVMNETGHASLKVYDLSGREVATLVNGMTDRGDHSVVFDAADLSSGVYFYTFETAAMSQTQKMVLVK